ncbi:MAG: hypothetical protein MK085_10120, partial [Phycisphaerales bacterium]|nr:hypothetical protein [Phycisphaerales bacterium]
MVLILTSSCALALGSPGETHAPVPEFRFNPESSVVLNLDVDGQEPTTEPVKPAFGDAGSIRGQVGGSIASDFNDVNLYLLRGSVSWFIIDGVSVDLEADVGYVQQSEGSNGVGGGASFLFRWHVIRKPTWSFYGE